MVGRQRSSGRDGVLERRSVMVGRCAGQRVIEQQDDGARLLPFQWAEGGCAELRAFSPRDVARGVARAVLAQAEWIAAAPADGPRPIAAVAGSQGGSARHLAQRGE